MFRTIASGLMTAALGVGAIIAALVTWGQHEITRPGPHESAVCLRVAQGETLRDVGARLAADGAIRSPLALRAAAMQTDGAQLRFGSHLIPPAASVATIVEIVGTTRGPGCGDEIALRVGVTGAQILVRGFDEEAAGLAEVARYEPGSGEPPEEYTRAADSPETRFRVVVAEGATSWHIAQSLAAAPFLDGEAEDLPAEGRLAPASYEVEPGASVGDLIAQMEARQERILEELWDERSDAAPASDPQEALILASIIEKESGIAQEQPIVSSVFVNRLAQGMRLQMDATVEYGVTQGREPLGRGLRRSELDEVTPYNTYQVDGLPPTPIANPGRGAIAAALAPAETDYLYFVADGTGGHAFAETLAEHNSNVALWREIEAQRNAQ